MKRPPKPVAPPAPSVHPRSTGAFDARQIALMADRAIAGDVVQPASIPELCALLAALQERGYGLKRRTEWEQRANPWLLLVTPNGVTKEVENV